MTIDRRHTDSGTVVVSVAGELDLLTAPALKWALIDELRNAPAHLVLDMAGVRFMDSTALGVLVGVDRSRDRSSRLSLISLQPQVREVFDVTGLHRSFRIFRSLEEAMSEPTRSPERADRAQSR